MLPFQLFLTVLATKYIKENSMAFKEGVIQGPVSINTAGTGATNIGIATNTGIVSIGNAAGTAFPEAISIGTATPETNYTFNALSLDALASVHTESASNIAGFVVDRHGNIPLFGAHQFMLRSDGTQGAPLIVVNGDTIAHHVYGGWDGTDYAWAAGIEVLVDGVPGNNDMPGRIEFSTSPDGTETPVLALKIDATQRVTVANGLTVTTGATTINSGTGQLDVSGDAANTTVTLGTGAGIKTVTLGSTFSTSSTTIACGTGGASFAGSANVHSTYFGGTFGASDTTLQSGSGALAVTSTNGILTINSGTGALSISNDASATTINIGTGGAAKTVTLGSTTTSSSLALRYGTSDFTLASATGTVMSALDTGEITYPLQSAFLASVTNTINNVTGDGTFYNVIQDTEVFDQNSDFDISTGAFTAPVTGKYMLCASVFFSGLAVANTDTRLNIAASNRIIYIARLSVGTIITSTFYCVGNNAIVDMDAGDIAYVLVYVTGATKVVDLLGDSGLANSFGGSLIC
jgi:hypothetical protein